MLKVQRAQRKEDGIARARVMSAAVLRQDSDEDDGDKAAAGV
jgi:hypothetical protein